MQLEVGVLRRVSLIVSVSVCLCLPIPLGAQAPTDNYIAQLQSLGYTNITISRTFLGRFRILANRDGKTRELVVARNGQLLFDYLDATAKGPSAVNGNLPQPPSQTGEEAAPSPNSSNEVIEDNPKDPDRVSTDQSSSSIK